MAPCVCSHPPPPELEGVVSLVYSHPPWVFQGLEEKPCDVQVLATHLSLNDE